MSEREENKAFSLSIRLFTTDFSIFPLVTEFHNVKLSRLLNLFTGCWAIRNSIILMNSFSGGQPAGGKHNSHMQFHS